MFPALILLAGCGTTTEYLLPPVSYEIDCPLITDPDEDSFEVQIEAMQETIRCEREQNAGQRAYRGEV